MRILIILLSLFFYSIESACPHGSISWNSNCYSFHTTKMRFAQAEIKCLQMGGHLVSIHDAFTNQVIIDNALDVFHNLTDFWIGANSLKSQNAWEWTDGSNFDYNDWKKGEPRNSSGLSCATASLHDAFWKADNCLKTKPFACDVTNGTPVTTFSTTTKHFTTTTKKSSSAAPISTTIKSPSSPPTPSTVCPNGWVSFGQSFYCFTWPTMLSWPEGETFCKNIGTHLASVHSVDELNFLNEQVISTKYALWIGLYTNDNGTTWKWTDNSAVDYLPWEEGAPILNENENCVYLGDEQGGPGIFGNFICSYSTPIVCKTT